MAGDEGEHTRFPCLATVRFSVAAVVSLLAVVVVVMVIVVVNRPEKISLSISGGYAQAEQLWWEYNSSSHGYDEPKKEVTLRVILNAYNPSGRGQIRCNVTNIRVLDMPNASFTGMVKIGSLFSPDKPLPFSAPPKTSHIVRTLVPIQKETGGLSYIFKNHQRESRFNTMVQVDIASKMQSLVDIASKLHPSTSPSGIITYYCWPVTVGYGTLDVAASGYAPCLTKEEINYFPDDLLGAVAAPAPTGHAG